MDGELRILFPDNKIRRIDLLVSPGISNSIRLRSSLVDRPKFLEWPHIEKDGIICLLEDLSTSDTTEILLAYL